MKPIFLTALVLICWLPGCSPTATVSPPKVSAVSIDPQVDAEVDKLLVFIGDRLSLMHDVARWKWQEGLPIADIERERVVIRRAIDLARKQGLDEKLAEQFMAAQIEAGKQIQEQDFAAWKTSGGPEKSGAVDLTKEIRPKIDKLSVALIETLSQLAPHLNDVQVQQVIQEGAARLSQDGAMNAQACATAIAPLLRK